MPRGLHEGITPVILTLNEAANLERTLGKLAWAKDIVVVDSGSEDGTAEIAARHPAVRFFTRPFDGHASQWNFAVSQTGIRTPWILALDADYVLSDGLVAELGRLEPGRGVCGYQARFVYCVDGSPLRATLYPPLTVLFRADAGSYVQDGHTQRLRVDGRVVPLEGVIFHDDRKSLAAWVSAQVRYARAEAEKFTAPGWRPGRWQERIRSLRVVAPFAMLFYCLFGKLLVLDGWPGVFYSFQRAFAELLLSLYLIRHDLSGRR
jgi:glycosyltransferase involved in cell wall biosynthesis